MQYQCSDIVVSLILNHILKDLFKIIYNPIGMVLWNLLSLICIHYDKKDKKKFTTLC